MVTKSLVEVPFSVHGLIFIESVRGPLYFAQRIFIWRTEFATGFSFCMDAELIK